MTQEELAALKNTIFGPKRVTTDSGTVEERTIDELKKGVNLLKKELAETGPDGVRQPAVYRLGFYGRFNM